MPSGTTASPTEPPASAESPSTPPASAGGPGGSRAVALLAIGCVLALAAWWVVRARERRSLARDLAPYATAPLPAADAPVDPALADLGARVFAARCSGCHALSGAPRLGPNLKGITRARELAWIRSMVLAPDSMTRSDPIARALLGAYDVPMMVAGGMDGSAALAVIEFLRRADGGARSGP